MLNFQTTDARSGAIDATALLDKGSKTSVHQAQSSPDQAMHHTIEVNGLTFAYPDGRQALSDVSLRIAPGEKVALVGPNGAGKSTLLLHLNGILSGEGQVQVAGLPVNQTN